MTGDSLDRLLAYHPKPQTEELLSSWLRRIAYGNGSKPHGFCQHLWPGTQIWTRDPDLFSDHSIIDDLVRLTGTGVDRIRGTLLADMNGILFEELRNVTRTPWVCPVGVFHRTRKRAGLSWCPACLQTGSVAYYRRRWRLAFVTGCELHGCRLADRCHNCAAPAAPHRRPDEECASCRADRRDHPWRPALPEALAMQREMIAVIEKREVPRLGGTSLHPLAYFHTLYRLLSLLCRSGPRSVDLRAVLGRRLGLDWSQMAYDPGYNSFETLRVNDRERAVALLSGLVSDWPNDLLSTCKKAGVWWSWLAWDQGPLRLPYVLYRPVRDHLYQGNIAERNAEQTDGPHEKRQRPSLPNRRSKAASAIAAAKKHG